MLPPFSQPLNEAWPVNADFVQHRVGPGFDQHRPIRKDDGWNGLVSACQFGKFDSITRRARQHVMPFVRDVMLRQRSGKHAGLQAVVVAVNDK